MPSNNLALCWKRYFPSELLTEYDLMPLAEALPAIHSPQDCRPSSSALDGDSYFKSFSFCSWRVVARRWQQQVGFRAPPLVATPDINARIERLFPFEFTAGQRAAIREVAGDMASETPMNRLLQGDVGSGKTVVAVYAMLTCVARGHQAALMAPTEILARQHAETLWLACSRPAASGTCCWWAVCRKNNGNPR